VVTNELKAETLVLVDEQGSVSGAGASRADATRTSPTAPAAIRSAVPADVAALARALAAAFEDDPIFRWLLPDERRRFDKLLRFFGLELRAVALPSGMAWMSAEASGACLELPPNEWRMPLRTQARHAPHFAAVFGRSLPRALITITKMERRHLREPHFYVPYVGVAPAGQGAGLGTKLLGRTVERADAAGLPTYLEATSERNAALYERLGFEHLGPFTVLGSPPLWPMRRPPLPRTD
jgi:GNAT superfamily N-acetyltransferase